MFSWEASLLFALGRSAGSGSLRQAAAGSAKRSRRGEAGVRVAEDAQLATNHLFLMNQPATVCGVSLQSCKRSCILSMLTLRLHFSASLHMAAPPLHATKIQLFSLSTICCQHRIQINFSPSQVNITQWAQSVKTIRYENVFNYLQRLGGTPPPPPPPPCMSWHPVFWCFGCWQLPVLSCWVNRHRSGSTGRDIRQSWSSQTCDFKLRMTSLTDLLPLCHRASLCCSVKITRFFACVHISCE